MRNFLKQGWAWLAGERRYFLALGPIYVLLVGFYVWSVENSGTSLTGYCASTHYDELARAFKMHQLSLPVDIDPVLLHAPNPYDPQYIDGHFIWDLSFYKGHYYLYFGATPCVLLFYPWLMITGQDMNECLGYVVICSVNLLLFGLMLRAFSRHLFPNCPLGWVAALFFVYGIASPMTYLLRLVDMYEIACASGSTCILFSLYFLFLAFDAPRRRWLYLALASFGWGAAIGSRPPFLFDGAFLFFAWLYLFYEQAGPRAVSRSRFLANTLALALPAIIIMGLIGWYNEARFDSPFEFGDRFQTSDSDDNRLPLMSGHYFPYRCLQYFVLPPDFYRQFPFIDPATYRLSWLYSDQSGGEHMTGIFTSFPILLVCLLWIRHVRMLDESRGRQLLGVYGMCVTAAAVGPWLILMICSFVSYRYLCDFVPTLYVLTALSLMARRQAAPFARWQTVVLVLFFAVTAYAGFAYSFIGDAGWIWNWYYLQHGPQPPWDAPAR